MDVRELLVELFDRVSGHVEEIVAGLDAEALLATPKPDANPVGWLVWHLTRVEDAHVSEILGREQVWVEGGWAERFGLDPDPGNTGYGHGPAEVARVRPAGPQVLLDHYAAVASRTAGLLATVTPAELDRVVDRRWDPPVTLGVRLVSIVDDEIQHAGQAAYLKGLLPVP